MQLVIADTSPISYLIQIGSIDLLPRMFEKIALPLAVQTELSSSRAPLPVRNWMAAPPVWLEIHDTAGLPQVSGLDEGETAALALGEFLRADLLLIDERHGSSIARKRGLRVTGTLGVLDIAGEHGLIDFGQAITNLKRTTFRRPEALLEHFCRNTRVDRQAPSVDSSGPFAIFSQPCTGVGSLLSRLFRLLYPRTRRRYRIP